MNRQIKKIFKRISKEADPDPRFVRALELKIREEISPRQPFSMWWKATAISITSISMMTIGAGTFAYSADAVVPGHALYPVRETMENIRVRMTHDDVSRAMVQMQQLKRRLREQQVLEMKQREFPTQHLDRYIRTLDSVIEESDHFSPEARQEIDQHIFEIQNAFSDDARALLRQKQGMIRRRLEQMSPERRQMLRELYEVRLSNPEPIR
ncbi:MAG: DUF5667 domain-containing protein [bacterium]|nr:DUF5667 domain-containing protein [bacterium]